MLYYVNFIGYIIIKGAPLVSRIKVSIIVPIYKVEKYLYQCIMSIRNQTLEDIEIILVDEGDNDACYEIMKEQQSLDHRIVIIHERNGGYGASVNKGIDIAHGEYIGIVESDDFIEPTMYEEMYKKAIEHDIDVLKIPFFCYSDADINNNAKKILCNYADYITINVPDKPFTILEYPHLMSVHASVWGGIYKTEYMNRHNIRFIHAKGASYVDVGFRIDTLMNAKKIMWFGKPFYIYRITNSESSTNNFNLKAMVARWREAHANFATKYKGTYDIVGPYLFIDEFLNTVSPYAIDGIRYNNAYEDIQRNLLLVDDSIIKTARYLDDYAKRLTLAMKHSKYFQFIVFMYIKKCRRLARRLLNFFKLKKN